MAQEHTPGPWKITEDDYGHEHWFGGYGEGQFVVNGWVNGGCKKDPSEWRKLQADARLIAAAPELLKALELCINAMFPGCPDEEWSIAYEKACAAIANTAHRMNFITVSVSRRETVF